MQNALLIFIVVFSLAIGFFLGLFLLSLDSPLLKKLFQKDEESLGSEHTDPVDALPEVTGESPQQISKPSPNAKLMLRVWKEEGKPPVYDLDGDYLEKDELPRDILNFITVHEDPIPEPEPQVAIPPPADVVPDPILEEPEIDEDQEPEVKMLSVVDEVNEILQKKLHGSPLAGKGIHLMENHNKEIRFWVGLNSYNDVEEIPDSEVREIIDQAVREWEKSRE